MPGTTKRWARYLGGWPNVARTNTVEVQERINAGKRGWCIVGAAWFAGMPFVAIRCCFLAFVYEATVAGLVACVLRASEHDKIDSHIIGKLRALLRGKACAKREDGRFKALSNAVVLRCWRMVPTAVELRVRRLMWYQEWAKHPDEYVQVFGAIFGQCPCDEEPPIDNDGRVVRASATAHLLQVYADLEVLGGIEEAREWWAELDGRVLLVFSEGKFCSAFVRFDVKVLRACFSGCVPSTARAV